MLSTFVTARRGALQVMIVHSAECHHALLHLTFLHCLWSLPVSLKESWQLFVLSTPVLTLLSCNRPRSLPVSLKESWQLFVLSAPAPLNGAGAGTLPCAAHYRGVCSADFALAFILVEALASPPTNSELAVVTIWTIGKTARVVDLSIPGVMPFDSLRSHAFETQNISASLHRLTLPHSNTIPTSFPNSILIGRRNAWSV